jgi:GNAT superfamily N-acetyltransferase
MDTAINDDRTAVRQAIRTVLAANCACDERDFLSDGVTIVEAGRRPGRMRFPIPSKPLAIATMGAGVVISAHADYLPWLRATLGNMPRDMIFSAAIISDLARTVTRDELDFRGPDLKYTCARCDLCPVTTPESIRIELVAANQIDDLYQYPGFGYALSYRQDRANDPRPDMLATVATQGGEIFGIAGASADADDLWQIGVQVIESARGHGIGRALVGHLTQGVLDAGKIPYYTTAVSNIGSRAIAISLGYWPAWTEMYARDRRGEPP